MQLHRSWILPRCSKGVLRGGVINCELQWFLKSIRACIRRSPDEWVGTDNIAAEHGVMRCGHRSRVATATIITREKSPSKSSALLPYFCENPQFLNTVTLVACICLATSQVEPDVQTTAVYTSADGQHPSHATPIPTPCSSSNPIQSKRLRFQQPTTKRPHDDVCILTTHFVLLSCQLLNDPVNKRKRLGTVRCVNNGRTDERTNGRTDERTNGRTDERTAAAKLCLKTYCTFGFFFNSLTVRW